MKKLLLFLLSITIAAATAAWSRYGGGDAYADLTTAPQMTGASLEEVLAYPEPIGNVAVSASGRVFFTVHPEARPQGNKLLEHVNGASVPYPARQSQAELFDTPLGIAIDRFDRLWVIDHGNHGLRTARIVVIDLNSDTVLREQRLDDRIAPPGSFLQDLQVSADGNTVVIADASFWRKQPALVVYDVETGTARRVLQNHPSVSAEHFLIRTRDREMRFLAGIVALRGGVDGLALGPKWLYYGAISGSGLYRIELQALRDAALSEQDLGAAVTRVADKPLSDGFSLDLDGRVYVTDVEHNAIFRISPKGRLTTLMRASRIRWPDALSFGPDGWLYVADSALPEVILRSQSHIEAQGPYKIYRFQPGATGIPGQ